MWETIRRERPDYTVANVCWWYAMGATTDWTVTPRPIYYADGKKAPDCYTRPPELHDELVDALGEFPLFTTGARAPRSPSSEWIIAATRPADAAQPTSTLGLRPAPRLRPAALRPRRRTRPSRAAREIDAALAPLLDDAERTRRHASSCCREYGITDADQPVDINRVLRREGLLEVYTQDGMEYLDPWTSRAFAVADHQVAHVYVDDPADLETVARSCCAGLARRRPRCSTASGQAAYGLDHERSGDLVLVADETPGSPTTTGSTTPARPTSPAASRSTASPATTRPSCSSTPRTRRSSSKAGLTLARKMVGLRYAMKVVPLDPSPVRGTHGRLPKDPTLGPMLVCSTPGAVAGSVAATDVRDLMLRLAGTS